MKPIRAEWLPYTLDFRQGWQTSRGKIHQRHGELLKLADAAGRTGWGDCAPLPDFGISPLAARGFAEECAQLDLLTQRLGIPLRRWLGGRFASDRLKLNGQGGSLCTFNAERQQAMQADGYRIIKLKVGVDPLGDEIAALKRLGQCAPKGLSWRFDANGAWSENEARQFLAACQGLSVDALEEPLKTPSANGFRALQTAVDFPLAIDESVSLVDQAFFSNPCVRRLVIKPARAGGLLAAMATGLRARQAGLEVIVTSALESACGTLACAQLAAALAPEQTHGLASDTIFASDTGRLPAVSQGHIELPCTPGLGFQPE